jgi:hypothetical protein
VTGAEQLVCHLYHHAHPLFFTATSAPHQVFHACRESARVGNFPRQNNASLLRNPSLVIYTRTFVCVLPFASPICHIYVEVDKFHLSRPGRRATGPLVTWREKFPSSIIYHRAVVASNICIPAGQRASSSFFSSLSPEGSQRRKIFFS